MITPRAGHILVEPVDLATNQLSSSIPGWQFPKPQFQGHPTCGFVVALADDDESDINIGDKVIFSADAPASRLRFEGQPLFVIPCSEIAGVVTE